MRWQRTVPAHRQPDRRLSLTFRWHSVSPYARTVRQQPAFRVSWPVRAASRHPRRHLRRGAARFWAWPRAKLVISGQTLVYVCIAITCTVTSAVRAHPFSAVFSALIADSITHTRHIHQDQPMCRERVNGVQEAAEELSQNTRLDNISYRSRSFHYRFNYMCSDQLEKPLRISKQVRVRSKVFFVSIPPPKGEQHANLFI